MGTTSIAEKEIRDHLRRVAHLGATLEEYAAAYDVDLEQLQWAKKTTGPLPDFVLVTVVDSAPSAGVVCRLVHADNWSMEC